MEVEEEGERKKSEREIRVSEREFNYSEFRFWRARFRVFFTSRWLMYSINNAKDSEID